MIDVAKEEFDWIDDAFDDKKTAEDMERAKGPGGAGILLVIVVLVAIALIFVSFVTVAGVMKTA